jgi:ZIP family zinc transporter
MTMAERMQGVEGPVRSPVRTWVMGAGPLVLLALLVAAFLVFDPTALFRAGFPPVEELTFDRVTLSAEPRGMTVHLINGGADPVTIAQVMVDDAYWQFSVQSGRTLSRLERGTIWIPYPWVEGEAHHIRLITNTGLTFETTVAVAVETPQPDIRFLGMFTLLGIYVGVLPVALGLLWYPFLRRIGRRWMNFFMSLTAGLLIFLGVDALDEALSSAAGLPDALQGIGLIVIGVLASVLTLIAVGQRTRSATQTKGEAYGRLILAYMIAVGIGLHNLGEGLAIGAAYALGEIALGAFLIVGFTIHNTTEGLAIVAPAAKDGLSLRQLALMGAIAGVPTILGAWIGGFTFVPALSVLFLAVGAGAIFQVVYELVKFMRRESASQAGAFVTLGGLVSGLLIMYATGLLVAA